MVDSLQASTQDHLRRLIEQIERLEDEKKDLGADIRDKYLEAKSVGFDVKTMRKVIRLRKQSKTDRDEEEAILAAYMHALGILSDLADTPLGQHALVRDFGPERIRVSK